ncbi:MAG: Lin0512 family protein [Pseudomonadota bacterium]
MNKTRLMLETGTGTDLHGGDYTKAASRAVKDALSHSSLSFVRVLGIDKDRMPVQVTIGVTRPERVDPGAIAALLPVGAVEVHVTAGGLDVADLEAGDFAVIASAAVEVFMPAKADGG